MSIGYLSNNDYSQHNEVENKLDNFLNQNKIPHLMFYGNYGCGKKTIINNFLNKLYKNIDHKERENYIMKINCGYGKGIKFVREDIKFFAKTNINCRNGLFKTILLYNADKLTIDAQSALRRCIELFSCSTRFIITAHDKSKILKPILSRFCSIYLPNPTNENLKLINYHEIKKNKITSSSHNQKNQTLKTMLNSFLKKYEKMSNQDKLLHLKSDVLIQFCDKIYNKGYTGLNIMDFIEQYKFIDNVGKYQILLYLNNNKKEFRCEKTFICFVLYCFVFRSIDPFHNILFM